MIEGTLRFFAPKLRAHCPHSGALLRFFCPQIEGTLRFCPQIEGTWCFLHPKLGPQPGALLRFVPPNWQHFTFCPQIEGTWRFFAPKLRAPCPQPGALLRVLPQNLGHFLRDRGHLGLTGEAMALLAYPLDQPLCLLLNNDHLDASLVISTTSGSHCIGWLIKI